MKDKRVTIHENKSIEENHPCPKCDGHLVIRIGADNEEFYGCSNYPYCEYTAPMQVNLSKICPHCGDYMILKKGPHGQFWGCNSYPNSNCPTQQYKIDK